MARASALFGAAFVVLCGGCIYATGVQDYKVDDDAGSNGNGGPDDACFTSSTSNACDNCCANNHSGDVTSFFTAVQSCACFDPGACSSSAACGNDLCVGSQPGSACVTCLNDNVNDATCPAISGNPYWQCAQHCSALPSGGGP